MSDTLDEPSTSSASQTLAPVGRLAREFGLRALARKARTAQLGGNALVAVGLSLTVLAAALLLWAGIVTGAGRVVLLIGAALLIRLRLLAVRLGAVTPADGMSAPPPRRGLIPWLNPIETAVLMVAAGLNAFGSGSNIAPVLGVIAGVLALLASARRQTAHGVHEPSHPHPTTLLAVTCLISTLAPLWGWRGSDDDHRPLRDLGGPGRSDRVGAASGRRLADGFSREMIAGPGLAAALNPGVLAPFAGVLCGDGLILGLAQPAL